MCHSRSTAQAPSSATAAIQLKRETIASPRRRMASRKATARIGVGLKTGNFATTMSKRRNGMPAPNAGIMRLAFSVPLVRRRAKNIPAEKKKMPTPAVTPRNASRSSICAEPISIHSPTAISVQRSAMTMRGADELRSARPSTTMLMSKNAEPDRGRVLIVPDAQPDQDKRKQRNKTLQSPRSFWRNCGPGPDRETGV